MSESEEKEHGKHVEERRGKDAEELQQVLKTVSDMVPSLIRGIIGSVFSAEAGQNMGAAAGNFYKELKAAGLPDQVAVQMTQDYIKAFTDIGSLIREAMGRKEGAAFKSGEGEAKEIGKAIREGIEKKLAEKAPEREEQTTR